MKFGYARVSTDEQSLDLQTDALDAAGCDKIFSEHVTGNGKKRQPELERLLEQLREGDVLVVYKLDRLGRSTINLIKFVEDFRERGIELVSLTDNIDTTTAMGKAMFGIMACMAQMERDLLVERTNAGLKAARKRGRVGGRPRVDKRDTDRALKLYATREYSVGEIQEMTGVKPHTLYRRLREEKQS